MRENNTLATVSISPYESDVDNAFNQPSFDEFNYLTLPSPFAHALFLSESETNLIGQRNVKRISSSKTVGPIAMKWFNLSMMSLMC